MKLKLNFKFIIAFMALTFVLGEAHEIVHTTVGRIICGCWGQRDFNNWGICESCTNPLALWATVAGPVFTFIVIWIGYRIIKKNESDNSKVLGFSLIFASLPFARILNAMLGIGDEIMVLTNLLNNHTTAWIIGLVGIVLVTFFPLVQAYRIVENKNKIGWFLLFFLVPTVLYILIILGVMNTLLSNQVLSEYWILGSPKLVSIWTFCVVILLLLTWKNMYYLKEEE